MLTLSANLPHATCSTLLATFRCNANASPIYMENCLTAAQAIPLNSLEEDTTPDDPEAKGSRELRPLTASMHYENIMCYISTDFLKDIAVVHKVSSTNFQILWPIVTKLNREENECS